MDIALIPTDQISDKQKRSSKDNYFLESMVKEHHNFILSIEIRKQLME